MRILVLAPQPFFQLRGTPIAVRRVAQVLGETGHSIDLLTYHLGENVPLPNCVIHRTARIPWITTVPPGFSIRKLICDVIMLFKAARLCRRESFDVIHAVEESVFIARLLKLLFHTPYIYDMDSSLPEQLHDRFPWLGPMAIPLRWVERLAISGSHGVVAVCQALEDIVHRDSPSTPVLRMEDTSPHAPLGNVTHSPFPESGNPTVLYVGNLQPYQGIDLLLQSFQLVANELTNSTLVIVGGSDSNIRKHKKTASTLSILDRVTFLGPKPLESIPSYLAAADVLVSPRTQGTNTPMKVYSYMESGTPLVATRLKTHTQVLDDSMCWLADPNPSPFSNAIMNAWNRPERSQQMAVAARQSAENNYSAEVQDEKLRLFYEDVEAQIVRARTESASVWKQTERLHEGAN